MGGHGHGRQAAEAAAAGLLRIPACSSQEELNTRLDGLHASLQTFFDELDPGKTSMRPGTTLTLLELRPGLPPLLYHVGDSRLYEIADGSAQALTVDHVPATGFAMRDLLGEAEWRQQVHGEHRSQIAQAFILGNAFSDPNRLSDGLCALDENNLPTYLRHMPDRRALEVRSDAVYVLASDGFWACANPAAWIAEWPALLSAQATGAGTGGEQPSAAALLHTLFERFIHSPPAGMHVDNLTAIVLRFHQDDPGENIDDTALPTLPIGPQM
jgi:serine/threonine protein phosphatase PrpC